MTEATPRQQIDRPATARWTGAGVITAVSIVGGIVLRWLQLGTNSLWFDEGYTAWVVSHPFGEIVRLIRADTAPPGHYLLLRVWVLLFGSSEAALRSMSALASSVALIVFWVVARRVLVRPPAVAVAVAVFAFGYMQAGYAHEARFYALMSLLGVVDFYLVLLLCDRSTPARLAATAACWTVSLYLNNVMAIYLAFLGIAWMVAPGARAVAGRLVDAAITSVVAAAGFAAWVPALLAQARAVRGNFWLARPTGWLLARGIAVYSGVNERSFDRVDLPGFWRVGRAFDWLQLNYCYVVLGAVLAGAVFVVSRTRRWRWPVALALLAAGPAVLVFVYSLGGQSIFMDRAFMGGSFALPLLIALPVTVRQTAISRRVVWGSIGILGVMIVPATISQRRGERAEDWRAASAAARPVPGRRQLTVFCANEGELLYDYYVRGGRYEPAGDLTGTPSDYFAVDPPHTMRRVLSGADLDGLRARLAIGGFDDVVLVHSHTGFADAGERTRAVLEARFQLVNKQGDFNVGVDRYRVRP
jgi:mannosyltransferase